ncbi:NAD(P)/FAD-dependent oxidoreductase [Acetivibrio clariflavus]|uniref:NAD(P)/FAD-dependent oxidoreductase n=1 Tax=Acetivibrio clariflavus TaxID=288965 RepID=UPI001FE055AC|nr:FAD-dependent oxidoreductase [Acetivibrio clariflavus]HOQ00616.1 FAD-dependent oxidoreductase [Acetivibrio clariflavus]HPU41962.1 FAD-dependent oxidoreductase [Acetivibrio clariflavus]
MILGNGAAGISAAEKLRQLNDNCEITVVSIEDVPVYTKFMLPDYIGGKIARNKLILRDMNYYDKNRIKLLLSEKIENIDSHQKVVRLLSGNILEYDKLLVAVGGSPVIPNIEGLRDIKYFTLNSIKDADNIIENAAEGQKAVIIGAGLTGIETAFALKRLGMNVTLVERGSRILPQQLDAASAEMLVEMIRNEGIELLLQRDVQRIVKNDGYLIETADGEKVGFDMLVIAIGTRPNLDIVKGLDIKTNRGILVNNYMETSVKDIYAAGDVAELQSNNNVGIVSSYIWPNALAQGKCAASNMAGQVQEFSSDAGFSNAVRLRDIPFVSMGMINPVEKEYESLVFCDKEDHIYRKVVLRDNKIKGLILLGDTSAANILSDFVKNGKDISQIKDIIAKKDFVEKYKAIK